MLAYNRTKLYEGLRKTIIRKLSQEQVDSTNAILDVLEIRDVPLQHAAYILATAYHEAQLRPVRETFAKTDVQAISRLNKAYRSKVGTKRCYWCRDANGQTWFGRGFVQLTWKDNYRKMGTRLGIDLLTNPEKALRKDVAAKVLVIGMTEGMFTGKKLADYKTYYSQRRVVNGIDKAKTFAATARKIEKVLKGAQEVKVNISPIEVVEPPVTTQPVSVPIGADVQTQPVSTSIAADVQTRVEGGKIIIEVTPLIDNKPKQVQKTSTWDASPLKIIDFRPPKMSTMIKKEATVTETKHAFRSKTFWGIVSGALTLATPLLFNLFGYNVSDDTAQALGQHGLSIIQLLLGVFSAGMTTYGRAEAKQGIYFISKG